MNGYDIYNRAVTLLGYKDRYGNPTDSEHLLRSAHNAVCEICTDLSVSAPALLTDDICACEKVTDAIAYGVAMLLALSQGDAAANRFFCDMYNAKRAAAKAASSTVKDVLPKVNSGVV